MNLLIDGELSNISFDRIKKDFAHENIDYDQPLKIKIADRYFNMNNGVLDITKKSVEPNYNKVVSGKNVSVKYYEVEAVRGEGAKATKVYTPDMVSFGRAGEITFDFTPESYNPNYSLFWFLMNHPMVKKEFDLERPEKDANDWIEDNRKRLKVENMFVTKSPAYITDEKLITLAPSFKIRNPSTIGLSQLRQQLMTKALADVDMFLSLIGSKELEVKAVIQELVDLKALFYNKGDNSWYYMYFPNDENIFIVTPDLRNKIYTTRPHMAAREMDDFAHFLGEVDTNDHLTSMQDLIITFKDKYNKHPDKKGVGAESLRKFTDRIQIQKP